MPERDAEVKRFQEYAAREPVRLSPAEGAELLAAAEQIEAGEFVDGQDLLDELQPRTGD